MASCVGGADHLTEVEMDMHSEAACLEWEACTGLRNGCRLVRCGENHGTVSYLHVSPRSGHSYSAGPETRRSYLSVLQEERWNCVVDDHSCYHIRLDFRFHLSRILYVDYFLCSPLSPARFVRLKPLSHRTQSRGLFLFQVAHKGSLTLGSLVVLVYLFLEEVGEVEGK